MGAHSNSTPSLGKAITNSENPGKSNVDVKVPAEPLAFLQPETGEVILVPAEDANALRSHYNHLSDMIAELHSANSAVYLCEEHMGELAANNAAYAVLSQAEKVLDFAIEWQIKAHSAVHTLFEKLAPIPDPAPADGSKRKEDKVNTAGAGAKLIELIALKHDSADERARKKAADKEPKMEDGVFKKKIASFANSGELIDAKKWPKKPPEKMIYVRSDKLKPAWPKFKDAQSTKWGDVYKKGADGKHTLDKAKLNTYVKEQLKSSTKISAKEFFGEDLELSASGTLGKWADEWNKTHTTESHGPLKVGGTKIGDMDFTAGAQLMRYSCGGSLNADLSVKDGHASIKAEGHAALDFAKAQADLDLYLPRKDGWLWTIYDLKGTEYPLIAGRCKLSLAVSGVVGASVNAELSLAVDVKQIDSGAPDGGGGNPPVRVKGKNGCKDKAARKKQTRSLNTDDEDNVGSLDVYCSAFAGIKASGSLTGTLEWRDPESKEKNFVEVASISPSVAGFLGIAADAKFICQFDADKGIFLLQAHAGLCIGVGAEGGLAFQVSAIQLGKFAMCLQYKLVYWEFQNLKIIADDAFQALTKLYFLAVQGGKAVEDFYAQGKRFLDRQISAANAALEKAQARRALAERILGKPEALRYAPPETKGMLIYKLTRHGALAEAATGHALAGDNYLGPERKAVLAILKTVSIQAELRNIIQHIDPAGIKGDYQTNKNALDEFFRIDAAGNLRVPFHKSPYPKQFDDSLDSMALNGDFGGWYAALYGYLMEEYPRGYALVAVTSPEYEALRHANDHPLFACEGMHAYYSNLT